MENKLTEKKLELEKEFSLLNEKINQFQQAIQSSTSRLFEIKGSLQIIEELNKQEDGKININS